VPSLRVAVRWGAAALGCVTFAACTNSATPTTSSAPATNSTSAPVTDDGTLVLGAVLPRGGVAPELGVSLRAAVKLAVTEINAAGGVMGKPVDLILRDEGDSAASSLLAVQELVQLGVDAIIGPTSSIDLLGTLGTSVDSGVLTCSPTASALSLDDFPDNGLLLRTVPSDSLQARALARVVEQSGSSSAVVVYLDDAYGRPFAEATEAAMRANGTNIAASVGFQSGADSIDAAVTAVAEANPQVVVVIADKSTGPAIISTIDGSLGQTTPTYVLNDAIRRPDASSVPFGRGLVERVTGVSPLAYPTSTDFLADLRTTESDATGLFAANAYDCTNLIALAAQASGSTNPFAIAANVPAISDGGLSCRDFAQCATVLDQGRNPDYDGPDGVVAIDANGNPSAAIFERFTFDANGRDVTTGLITIGPV